MNVNQETKPRIAISGINGFPGSIILRWLDGEIQRGNNPIADRYSEIVAIDIFPPALSEKLQKTKFFKLDFTETTIDQKISDVFLKENVDTLIHLAFHVNPRKISSYSHELHSIGTMYLLNACAKNNVRKIITMSTTHVYGAFANNPGFLSEDHAMRGGSLARRIRDRVDIEKQLLKYAKANPNCTVTTLRPCSILGPSIHNIATHYLSSKVCFTPLGFDPLVQLVHEDDVIRAFQIVIEQDHSGIFNIVGEGVLPLLTLLRMSGRIIVPLANFVLFSLTQFAWQTNIGVFSPKYVDFLRYSWVADGDKAETTLGFKPKYSTKETLLAFMAQERLRAVHLS